MTAPTEPGGPGLERATVRGIGVIVIGVVVGLVLLSQSDGLVDVTAARPSADETTTTAAPPDTGPSEIVPTTAQQGGRGPRQPAEVTAVVLNGSGQGGVAGENTDSLSSAGYQVGEAANAPSTEQTVVYYARGFEADAFAVAETLGIRGDAQPMPGEVANADGENVNDGETDVIVVLGSDLGQG